MAIEKNNFKVSRFDSEFSVGSRSRDSMSSGDDELRRQSPMDSEDDDEFDDADSGAGSDDFELLDLGESGSEFCQVGDQSCRIPFELYDLADFSEILSLDVWNECLTDDERLQLTRYLPDMDQETYMHTLKDLFEGANFHFASPVAKLFDMLKGGLCEPRVALYRQGLNTFMRHRHYHSIRNHQNSMVTNLLQIRDAWQNCKGYSIEEKLRVLNIVRSQKSLMGEKMDNMRTDSSEHEGSVERTFGMRPKGKIVKKKDDNDPSYLVSPSSDFIPRGQQVPMESAKHGRQNPKGLLKLVGSKVRPPKDLLSNAHPHVKSHLKSTSSYGSGSALPRLGKASGYDGRDMPHQLRDQMAFYDVDDSYKDAAYGLGPYSRDLNEPLSSFIGQSGPTKSGKRRQVTRGDKYVGSGYVDVPISTMNDFPAYGHNMSVNQLSDIRVLTAKPSNTRRLYDLGKKGKEYVDPAFDDQTMAYKVPSKGNHGEYLDGTRPYWMTKAQPGMSSADTSLRYDEWDGRGKKGKKGKDMYISNTRLSRSPQQLMDNRYHSENQGKPFIDKVRKTPAQNGVKGAKLASSLKVSRVYDRGEETESDSSDQPDAQEENVPLTMSKLPFSGNALENRRSSASKSTIDRGKNKLLKKVQKASIQPIDAMLPNSRITVDSGRHLEAMDAEDYFLDNRRESSMQTGDHLQGSVSGFVDSSYIDGSGKSNAGNKKSSKKMGKKAFLRGSASGNSSKPSTKMSPADRKPRGAMGHDSSSHPSILSPNFVEDDVCVYGDGRFNIADRSVNADADDYDSMLVGCSSLVKKRKAESTIDDVDRQEESEFTSSALQQKCDASVHSKKRARKKIEADDGALGLESPTVIKNTVLDEQPEKKPKKKQFTLITPTIHTGFSFSVVHLLSAVRLAMITPKPEDSLDAIKHFENIDESLKVMEEQKGEYQRMSGSLENMDGNELEGAELLNKKSLFTVQEIVGRVRLNPGDPRILETQEPLQDLIRGVLRIFSSKTAPLGAKGWKPLICYEKSSKSWSWIGPVPQISPEGERVEEVASPEFWGIPQKMLVKLVDSFANWLHSGQETLQQIGRLPPPPAELMQNVDDKERFRDLRAQKSLTTINPSTDEVRAYFRKEEQLRYSLPDRAFSYTAADGKKSIVAPLRRGGGKPTSKARDHFMLKRDRPPHVTILCLVRDAAARLPGSIGTRADVCTLIRDSQYIVEDVTDAQVNQVVSGALDRLHYERDPCVLFDGERKLWVYMHREREEEDFEDDGTSSTKKWRRQKKDPNEQGDQEAVTVAFPGSDLNAEPSFNENDKGAEEGVYDDTRQISEDNTDNTRVPEQNSVHPSHPIMWDSLGLDHMQDDKLICQESSTNDLNDNSFDGERSIGLLGASL